jgi:Sec-independent protein secretion pathway component TatC
MFNWLFKKVVTLREKVAVDLGGGDEEKPFLDHLEDLRSMIVKIAITLIVITLITFVYVEELLAIIKYPLVMAGIADKITLQNFKVTGGFMTAMNISLVAGVILAFPVLLYFVLQFVLPGLRSNEKKVIFPALCVGAGLFMTGVVFAYYVVTPRALTFFYEYSRDIGGNTKAKEDAAAAAAAAAALEAQKAATPPATTPGQTTAATTPTQILGTDGKIYVKCCQACTCGMPPGVVAATTPPPVKPGTPGTTPPPGPPPAPAPDPVPATTAAAAIAVPVAAAVAAPFIWELTEYVKFICQFILIFGACFELPVVVMAMVKMDVLNYKVMKTTRSWAAIIIAVAAALITPTQDALTLGLLAVPMYALYEICIWLAWWMEKRDRKLYPEYYKDLDKDAAALEVSDDWDNDTYNPWGGGSEGDDEEDDGSGSKPKPAPKPAPSSGDSQPDTDTGSPSDSQSTDTPSDSSYSPPEAGISSDSQPDSDIPKLDTPGDETPKKLDAPADETPKPDKPAAEKSPDEPTADKRDTD